MRFNRFITFSLCLLLIFCFPLIKYEVIQVHNISSFFHELFNQIQSNPLNELTISTIFQITLNDMQPKKWTDQLLFVSNIVFRADQFYHVLQLKFFRHMIICDVNSCIIINGLFYGKIDFIRRSLIIMIFKQIQFIKIICQLFMNFSFDMWNLSNMEEEQYYHQFLGENNDNKQDFDQFMELEKEDKQKYSSLELKNQKSNKQSTDQQIIQRSVENLSYQFKKFNSQTKYKSSMKPKRKRIIKPSPYHNFQKHLNTTIKHILSPLPILTTIPSNIRQLAKQIWGVFCTNKNETKKMLHFVFNQFNEHLIKQQQLSELGFQKIYRQSSLQDIGSAKNYLTCLALNEITDNNIDDYLQKRRIKNVIKFKRYIMLFRHELQDGFIKKRFTNKNKKEEIKELINSSNR